jgi:glucoamylase
MARPVMLGNGALTVGLNEQGLVHDFYYPYVGLDNLTTARSMEHKIGVWVDGVFSWVDETWEISVNFESSALVSDVSMVNAKLGIELHTVDFVDPDWNVLCRNITILNAVAKKREIRVFMHQVFQISRAGRADTALFVPDENYILDYKGRCCLLISAQAGPDKKPFDQFSVGNYGIEGKEGTYRDAEDGELSGNSVEHGGVDSVLRFSFSVAGGSQASFDYWVVAADSQQAAEKIHHKLQTDGIEERLAHTRDYWEDWFAIAEPRIQKLPREHQDLVKKSLMVIKAHTDKRGGIIASCDSSIYNYGRDYYSYVWPRDGAYAVWPLIRLGYKEEPRKFFEFCRDILHDDGYLMHKYQPDKAIGSTWHPLLHEQRKELAIQEDETASVLYMLGEYHTYTKDDEFVRSLYDTFIQPAANFLAEFMDEQTNLPHASYDLWEEKFLTNTYTAAVTYQALLVAADFADQFEYPDNAVHWRNAAAAISRGVSVFFDPERQAYRKGYLLQSDGSLSYDNTLDISSFYGVVMYGLQSVNAPEVISSLKLIEETLLNQSPSGGAPRYEHDSYFAVSDEYQGNPWFVTTLWIAQFYAKVGRTKDAQAILQWAVERALPSGILSEQIDPVNNHGLSVTPLVWSHAEFVNTALDLAKVAGKSEPDA